MDGRYTLTYRDNSGKVAVAVEFDSNNMDTFLDKVVTFMQQVGFRNVETLDAYKLPTPEDLSPEAYDFRYSKPEKSVGRPIDPRQTDLEDFIPSEEDSE